MSFLFEPAFHWGGPVTWIELIGGLTTFVMVICVARQIIWNWPLSLVGTACMAAFFLHIDLPANACLQGIFFLLGIWGWFEWRRRDKASADGERRVRRATKREGAAALVCFLALWMASHWALGEIAGSAQQLWDSCTFSLGVTATYGQAKKIVESWYVWILLDVISVPLFWSQDGRLTALLFCLLAVVSSFGLRAWTHDLRSQARGQQPDTDRQRRTPGSDGRP